MLVFPPSLYPTKVIDYARISPKFLKPNNIFNSKKVIDLRQYFAQICETDQHFFETNLHF